jgi:hypothetical protein
VDNSPEPVDDGGDRDHPAGPGGPVTPSGPADRDADGNDPDGNDPDGNDPDGNDPEDQDADGPDRDGRDGGRDPLRFNSWRQRSATGAVMTGIAMGLQQALELPRQEPAFMIEASGEPEDPDRPIDLRFDPDSPADTVAIIRRPPPTDPTEDHSPPS